MAAGTTGPITAATPSTKREQVFAARPDQVRMVRAFIAAVLPGCPVADDAILCVSELAANSCLHSASGKAGGTFTVRAEIHAGDYVWIEVEDSGGPWNARTRRDGRAHGLEIVRALATDSGIDGDPLTGWIAWARLDMPAASEPAR
jgi:anti-sigma regulatory factor (Ser/Thr protein kinase)